MDERLTQVEKNKQTAINNSNNIYNGLLKDNQNQYDQGNEFLNQQEKIQNDVLDKQLAFNREEIEKQKAETTKNFETESKKALNDYTSYINPYGYESESLASSGLLKSGVSETSKLGAWNSYQNRLSTANKAMQDAFTQFDSDLNQAILNNDANKAQVALDKLKAQQELLNQFYSNKSTLKQNQLSNNQNLDTEYHGRYQDVLNQINTEKSLQEEIRQFNEQLAYQRQKDAQDQANWEKEYALSLAKTRSSSSSLGGLSGSLSGGSQSGKNSSGSNTLGNSESVQKKSDYYFSNGYQPRYINNTKLTATGALVKDLYGSGNSNGNGASIDNQNIWVANGRYYIWDGSSRTYEDKTNDVKKMNFSITKNGKIVLGKVNSSSKNTSNLLKTGGSNVSYFK